MYVNANNFNIPVEITPGIRAGEDEGELFEEVNSCMIYLIHYKNLCKCHNVPLPITTIKEKKRNTKYFSLKMIQCNDSPGDFFLETY
jgi:hypothetical protein